MTYRLVSRHTGREWSRTKKYSRTELMWLARRRGLHFKDESRRGLALYKAGREVARFREEAEPPEAVVFSR